MKKKTESGIEVFRELYLRHTNGAKAIRDVLLQNVVAPWFHFKEREEEIKDGSNGGNDVITIGREKKEKKVAVSLWLFEEANGYKVSNIVPLVSGDLGIKGYNEVLNDFVDQVVTPAAKVGGFEVLLTLEFQSIDNWTDKKTAMALSKFSALANKSTGRSHPLDEMRWLDFLITAHENKTTLDAEFLARWLIEVEQWPAQTAHELASEYAFSRSLLMRHDGMN